MNRRGFIQVIFGSILSRIGLAAIGKQRQKEPLPKRLESKSRDCLIARAERHRKLYAVVRQLDNQDMPIVAVLPFEEAQDGFYMSQELPGDLEGACSVDVYKKTPQGDRCISYFNAFVSRT